MGLACLAGRLTRVLQLGSYRGVEIDSETSVAARIGRFPAADCGESPTCKGKEHLFSRRANFAASRDNDPPRMFGAVVDDNCKIRVGRI